MFHWSSHLPTWRLASSGVNRDNGVRNDGISSVTHLQIALSTIQYHLSSTVGTTIHLGLYVHTTHCKTNLISSRMS